MKTEAALLIANVCRYIVTLLKSGNGNYATYISRDYYAACREYEAGRYGAVCERLEWIKR